MYDHGMTDVAHKFICTIHTIVSINSLLTTTNKCTNAQSLCSNMQYFTAQWTQWKRTLKAAVLWHYWNTQIGRRSYTQDWILVDLISQKAKSLYTRHDTLPASMPLIIAFVPLEHDELLEWLI